MSSSSTLNLFVLTGAGISAESGIPTFQGTSRRGHSHYELANIDTWQRNPELVWEYYSERRARARDAKPNPAHTALAEFERSGAVKRFFLCTQNVDSLHEAAGSKNIIHIHGKLFESRCAHLCGKPALSDFEGHSSDALPRCACGALLRPNICMFGEQPFELDRVYTELHQCNAFLAIGTSGSVQPVASFVEALKRNHVRTLYAGLDEPANSAYFDEVHLGLASKILSRVLERLSAA